MIDFTDPDQVMNQGQRIPIDTVEAYTAARQAAHAIFDAPPKREWDDDAAQQFDQRVRSGQSVQQIIAHTLEDRKARFDE